MVQIAIQPHPTLQLYSRNGPYLGTLLSWDTSAYDRRHPKMDLSKGDLLKLLSYLEGELQARDVVIATLKAEKAKQLLYQAKYGRFGLGDPFMALQRDSDNMKDSSFDESAIKLMYDNQLAQLENLIATQRKAQVKMREQLQAAEKRFHKSTSELEDEKRKHAQDTAQGDDVTYMLEKERERLKQEVDFEKGQSKRLEKDLKKSLASLEEERANSGKHKQVALMLIKERKKLEDILLLEKHKRSTAEKLLNSDKSKIRDIVDGLEEESKRSLKMEAVMEKQLSEFDVEREQLRNKFAREETRSTELQTSVEMLSKQLEALQVQLAQERAAMCATPQSIEIRSSLSPGKTKEGSREGSQTDGAVFPGSQHRKPVTPAKPLEKIAVNSYPGAGQTELNLTPGTTVYAMPSGGKLSVHVGGGMAGNSPRKPVAVGRGTPPPIPPNKPILVSPLPGVVREGITRAVSPKPAPPPKAGISLAKERAGFLQTDGQGDGKSTKFPVNQVNVVSNQPGGVRERAPVSDNSPMRKTTQLGSVAVGNVSDSPHLDFLGQEMADLQQVISSMATGESSSYSVNLSSSSSLASLPSLHHLASTGNHSQLLTLLLDSSIDPSQPLHDGTTPLHTAVESSHEACTHTLILHNADVNAMREDLITPLHIAAGAGHYGCMKLLLDHNGNVNQPDRGNWTPLHWVATNGSVPCCHLLLQHGAKVHSVTNEGWTPLHAAVNSGHSEVLKLLLTHATHTDIHNDLVNVADKDGWTIAHLAALRPKKDCLQVLLENCPADLSKEDNWGRNVYELASLPCKDFISKLANKNSPNCTVCIDITTTSEGSANLIGLDSEAILGSIQVTEETSWDDLEDSLRELLCVYFKSLDTGLKTRKTTRLEPDPTNQPFTLGLSTASVKQFSIGLYYWCPGAVIHLSPYEIMCNNKSYQIRVHLGGGDSFPDSASFETLIPITMVQNYIRLIEQYRSVVFYGPVGSGKSLLADRLAHCIKMKADDQGFDTELIQLTCTSNFTHDELVNLLLCKGCIVRLRSESNMENDHAKAPIFILNELDKINIAEVFGDLLKSLEHRGENSTFKLKGLEGKEEDLFYFVDNFYLIATMDRTRSTGLELSVQQRFRWVHFRVDTEPTKHLLARHLFRRLIHTFGGGEPPIESPVYKAVEWVVCVWQRLNDGLAKLGLPEVVFGPGLFFSCPICPDDPQQTLHWLCEVWNSTIAPVVTDAVVKGTGAEASQGGQQKVANTALYVLMQRSVMAGCPLTGTEKEKYLSQFQGSNELEVPIRSRSHSHTELYLSPSSPLSPTVQLKSILGITSPEARDSNKRTSWIPIGAKHNGAVCGPADNELPHKIPATRLTTSKAFSDTDLTASLPKVRRLEIRAPNLNTRSRNHCSITGKLPHSSSLPVESSSASGLKSPSKGDSDSSAFNFSPTHTCLSEMSSSSSNSTSPSFTTKLPRAITVFKTTLSSVDQSRNKVSTAKVTSPESNNKSVYGGQNNLSDSTAIKPRLNLSSPKRYKPKAQSLTPEAKTNNMKNEETKMFQFDGEDTCGDSAFEPPKPKSPRTNHITVPFQTPLVIETSLNWCESKANPFRIRLPSPALEEGDKKKSKESATGDVWQSMPPASSDLKHSALSSSSVRTVECGPKLTVPTAASNARVFLLSGHKNENSDVENSFGENSFGASISNNNSIQSSANPSTQNIRLMLLPDDISVGKVEKEASPDVIPKTDVTVERELVFSPGRTERNTPKEVLAKVLQDEERVSLC